MGPIWNSLTGRLSVGFLRFPLAETGRAIKGGERGGGGTET